MSLPPCSKRRMMPDGRRASCGPAATALGGKPALFDAASTCRDCALIGGPIDGKAPADHGAFVDLIVSATGAKHPTRGFEGSPAHLARAQKCDACPHRTFRQDLGYAVCAGCRNCGHRRNTPLEQLLSDPRFGCPVGSFPRAA